MGFIYKITSPNNKVYVGKTYNLKKRINSHRCSAKKGNNIILHNSIRKYGWENHVLEVIEEIEDCILNEREIFWIAELKTYVYDNPQGMNMTKGGDGQRTTWMHKTELRKWYSDRFSKEGNPFYGKKHTESAKKKMSIAARERNLKDGRKVPEWGAKKGYEKVRKPILCYSVANGEFICEFKSITEAAKTLGVHKNSISISCIKLNRVAGEYVFRYKDGDIPLKIDFAKSRYAHKVRPVFLLDNYFKIIKKFSSSKKAAESLGIPKTSIVRSAANMQRLRTGHIFAYVDSYNRDFFDITNSKSASQKNETAYNSGVSDFKTKLASEVGGALKALNI